MSSAKSPRRSAVAWATLAELAIAPLMWRRSRASGDRI
jgi:hypothetical protein